MDPYWPKCSKVAKRGQKGIPPMYLLITGAEHVIGTWITRSSVTTDDVFNTQSRVTRSVTRSTPLEAKRRSRSGGVSDHLLDLLNVIT